MGDFIKLISESSIPGLSIAASSGKKIRIIFWILASIGCLSIFVFSSHGIIITYLTDNVATSINVNSMASVQFPAVTICNINPFQCSKLKSVNFHIKQLLLACRNSSGHITTKPKRRKMLLNNIFSLDTNSRIEFGYSLDEMIKSCKKSTTECPKSDFQMLVHPQYGNCYTYRSSWTKSGPVRKTGSIYDNFGPANGLEMVFDANYENYIPGIYEEGGIRVAIHDPNVVPNIETDGFNIQPRMATSVGFRKKTYQRLNEAGRKCQKYLNYGDEALNEKLILPKEKYHQMRCLAIYRQLEMVNFCKCRDVDLPAFEMFPTQKSCSELAGKEKSNIIDQCREKVYKKVDESFCNRECNQVMYDKTITTADWPSHGHKSTVFKFYNITDQDQEYFLKNFGKIIVYQESLMAESITEELKFTMLTLISNVGGLAGLYLGMSVLTFFEIFDVIIRGFYQKRKESNKVSKISLRSEKY